MAASRSLVIVESPAKAKTISKFLGNAFDVRASVGHIRDLLKSTLSVDVDHDFTPKYRVPNEKKQVVKELKAEAARAEEIYLATDPDREGEAISWHLLEAAEIEPARARRVVFHEITKPAIEEAFGHPRQIAMDLVNAQQARRILDRGTSARGLELLFVEGDQPIGEFVAGRGFPLAARVVVTQVIGYGHRGAGVELARPIGWFARPITLVGRHLRDMTHQGYARSGESPG